MKPENPTPRDREEHLHRPDPTNDPIDLANEQIVIAEEPVRENPPAEAQATALAGLHEIGRMLDDPAIPAVNISRLILRRMTCLLEDLQQTPTSGSFARSDHELKGLRQLHNVLLDSLTLHQNEDVVNLDGHKFEVVYDYMMGSLVTALQQAGIPELQIVCIMREVRDQLSLCYEVLKRDLAKL
jgi:hypothetical protein